MQLFSVIFQIYENGNGEYVDQILRNHAEILDTKNIPVLRMKNVGHEFINNPIPMLTPCRLEFQGRHEAKLAFKL